MCKKRNCLLFMAVVYLYGKNVGSSVINLQNNGYNGLVIAINPEVPENRSLIDAIKDVWTEASRTLYTATLHRAYYSDITILIPKTWTQYTATQAQKESYDTADVLIAYPNPLYQDQPYTLQYGGCGEPATYIHLTPSYLLDSKSVDVFGPKGKAIVHEWGHYRWGVFDEVYTYGYSPFYYNNNGDIEATRCPTNLKGVYKVIDYSTGQSRDCNRNLENGLPEDGCVFIPYDEQSFDLSASIMSHHYVEKVETFCHNNKNDSYNLHNKAAPNEQNRMCNLRSTWEVILESPDFKNNANSPNIPLLNTVPTFRIVKPESSRRFVLVLDTSGSMDGSRLLQMRQVVGIFISQFIPTGDRVSMVEFSSSAKVLVELTSIQTSIDRDNLLKLVPNDAQGGTCIGCGLTEALEVLNKGEESASGGNIILFTDGQETNHPYVKEVRDDIIREGAIVHAIFFTTAANADLQQLVTDTQGVWFFGSDSNILAILGAFSALATPKDGDVFNEVLQVHSTMFEVSKYSTYTGQVTIDFTVGNSTVFSFAWSQYNIAIGVVIESPSGCTYSTNSQDGNLCSDYTSPEINTDFEIVSFTIPGKAQAGNWRYYVSSASANSQIVTATVTSQASDMSTEPVVVKSGLDKVAADTGEAIVVYAQVSQGLAPVLGADVSAAIQRPDGATVNVELFDAGSAPDVRKDDGVYSRYFTGYNTAGRYAVQVTVSQTDNGKALVHNYKSSSSRAAVNIGSVDSKGKVNINQEAEKYQENEIISADVGAFSRVVTSQGFEYTGKTVNNNDDFFPPSKVFDLIGAQTDVYNSSSGVILTFTAPGSDFDSGTANRYEIRYIVDNIAQLVDAFDTCTLVTPTDLIQGDVFFPKPAGEKEQFVLKPLPSEQAKQITLGFAMRAHDTKNEADISNVAPVTYFYQAPGAANHQTATSRVLLLGVLFAMIVSSTL